MSNNASDYDHLVKRVIGYHADIIETLDDLAALHAETATAVANLRDRVDQIEQRVGELGTTLERMVGRLDGLEAAK